MILAKNGIGTSHFFTLIVSVLFVSVTHAQTQWTNHVPYLHEIAYGNGVYVVVGEAPLVSPDLTNWSQSKLALTNHWRGLDFGNGWFVAASMNGGIFRSKDGNEWNPVNVQIAPDDFGMNGRFRKVAFLNGRFFALSRTIFVSDDGENWIAANRLPDPSASYSDILWTGTGMWRWDHAVTSAHLKTARHGQLSQRWKIIGSKERATGHQK